jgi:predicted XRE-type DNA-binding protein
MKQTKFPSERELAKMRKLLSKGAASYVLPDDADPVDRIKYEICQDIVMFMNKHNLSQRQLASRIGINESLISKITYCKIESFTVDRLLGYLYALYDRVEVKIKVA